MYDTHVRRLILTLLCAFALPLSAAELRVASPGAGEVVRGGESLTLEWSATALPSRAEEWEAFLSIDGGRYYAFRVTPHLDLKLRRVAFEVPNVATSQARILIRAGDEREEHVYELPWTFSIARTVRAEAPMAPALSRGESAREGDPGKEGSMSLSMALLLLASIASAQQQPRTSETIEVTATRIAEDVTIVPAAVTVIDGDELRARNARDLQTALGFAAGVSIAPGGDAGPAGVVPEFWGIREFDAFLLVVDGVPWGGAFNPDTQTLDLENVDRIEVVRGAAPVMYGATSFVGVIHVI